jgi:hypothetical protein
VASQLFLDLRALARGPAPEQRTTAPKGSAPRFLLGTHRPAWLAAAF